MPPGNVLLTNAEKSQMLFPNCLGWDCSVRSDCHNPYVCKNGDQFNGNGISVWAYAGIVYVNSFLPAPYQPYDTDGNKIPYVNLCGASGVPFSCQGREPGRPAFRAPRVRHAVKKSSA